jgi:hypothetical protein
MNKELEDFFTLYEAKVINALMEGHCSPLRISIATGIVRERV